MKKVVFSLALVFGLVAFGASDAKAAVCFDFSAFCDCLTLNAVVDASDGNIRRVQSSTWENQDCAGTTSNVQGLAADGKNSVGGELNPAFGLGGLNFNFTWLAGSGLFDLDLWDGAVQSKIQDDTPYVIVPGACPSDCSAALKAPGLPPSRQK